MTDVWFDRLYVLDSGRNMEGIGVDLNWQLAGKKSLKYFPQFKIKIIL